ncbi:MAG: hypothetical protein K2I80_12475 [Ruminococcus sp.]|nr:hypothetical protein [Ruminococcus sp.]
MKFKNEYHKTLFWVIMQKMTRDDGYHKAIAYLIALDDVCKDHVEEIYDFKKRCIMPDCLKKSWQTGTSLKTTRLAFNLFTGHINWCPDFMKAECTPENIFRSEYAPYYWEAIKIRYPEYTGENMTEQEESEAYIYEYNEGNDDECRRSSSAISKSLLLCLSLPSMIIWCLLLSPTVLGISICTAFICVSSQH